MADWRDTVTGGMDLPVGSSSEKDMQIVVEGGTGDVQIQYLGSDGSTYATPAGAEFTLTGDEVKVVQRANAPAMRIIATGDAKFLVVR